MPKDIYPSSALIMAPLSGHTDLPYRRSLRRHGCRFAFTEMIDAGSLVYAHKKSVMFLDRGPEEDWLGTQLVGSEPETLKKAVEIINGREFSVVDFNLGCPAPKVVKKGEGAALARREDDALRAFDAIVSASRFPVTAKTRIIDEEDPEPTIRLCLRLRDAGAAAITIHGRVMKAFYSGPVFHRVISEARRELGIQVVANGGVMGMASWRAITEGTGCDCVMLARGAMGNPWLFDEIQKAASYEPPNVENFVNELELHVGEIISYYGCELGFKLCRKVILDYMRGRGFGGELKNRIARLCSNAELRAFMDELRRSPSDGYWSWLRSNPDVDRRLSSGG